jgi:hypothetical protein
MPLPFFSRCLPAKFARAPPKRRSPARARSSGIDLAGVDRVGKRRLGIPFLFVDQRVVQAPASLAASGDGRLRILLAVSGRWQGAK